MSYMIVDKCRMCDFYVIVGTVDDHRRVLQAHERSAHGEVDFEHQDHLDG
jgi:hypothetical protein